MEAIELVEMLEGRETAGKTICVDKLPPSRRTEAFLWHVRLPKWKEFLIVKAVIGTFPGGFHQKYASLLPGLDSAASPW